MLDHNLVLKSDELFLAGDITAAVGKDGAKGLYARDTRFLSRFAVTLGGRPLETLAVRVTGAATATITTGNQTLVTPEGDLPPLTVTVDQHVTLGADLRVRVRVRNFSGRAVAVPLEITWAADFRDLFDIRGFQRDGRGTLRPAVETDGGVLLAYDGLDGSAVGTVITVAQAATITLTPHMTATFLLDLSAGGAWETLVVVTPRPAGAPISDRTTADSAAAAIPATVSTNHAGFNAFLARSQSDLEMLQTTFPEGSLPAAGIPWYVAPFGRDSLIVGLQTVHLAPRRAEGTLRVLAALQGTKDDPWRGEEPGKILHEIRYGEMARRGEIPHTPYFGTVDATPLWLMLFADVVAWTGDETLYHDLLPHAKRALEWIEGPGDPDGDGLVEYVAHEPDGIHIVHQVWKDSHNSLNRPDGSPVWGPVAAVEVQGYVFAAYSRLADVADRHDGDWATELRAKAERIRALVEDRFWLEDEGSYAQALDAEKAQVAAISSNPGHLLFCGLPTAERAARMATRFAAPDLDCGWGIRTLSAEMPTYNPMSYHNGSVWPHDNSLIAAGLARYGHRAAALRIIEAFFTVACTDPLHRLPELYCGFARENGGASAPVAYPVSCSPQAWAAAAAPLVVGALLGMRLDLAHDRLLIDPDLPAWIGEATVHGLDIRGKAASFTIRRIGPEYEVLSSGPVARG